jgi:DNA-binding MurR/RpiR family transcriptional regulator
MSKLYIGPSIDASYQVSVHLAMGFQRIRLKCEKLTDDGHQVMAKAHIAKMYVDVTLKNVLCANFTFDGLLF